MGKKGFTIVEVILVLVWLAGFTLTIYVTHLIILALNKYIGA